MWVNIREHKLVGRALAEARKKAGMTQDELANHLRKPQSFVSAYEAGQRRIDVLELIRIAQALNADPKKILTRIIALR